MRNWLRRVGLAGTLAGAAALAACSSIEAVRLQPETVEVGPGLRPIAAIQANASTLYFLFIPIPGVSLDRVVNQLLVVRAKMMGADKVAQLQFDIDGCHGFWCFWKILGYREASASGIAVQVMAPPDDPAADQGPEAPATPPPPPPPAGP
jgi:hypothetical protein